MHFGAVNTEDGKPMMGMLMTPAVPFYLVDIRWNLDVGSRRSVVLTIDSRRYTAIAIATSVHGFTLVNRLPDEKLRISDKTSFKVELDGIGVWTYDANGISDVMKDGFAGLVASGQ
jgi:hypothetical protein